jgi:hypothetical protein
MWRRFSAPASDTSPLQTTTPNTMPNKETNPAKPTPAQPVVQASGVKEHELPAQRPLGWGQRRRSSIMERLTRESTKEGIILF